MPKVAPWSHFKKWLDQQSQFELYILYTSFAIVSSYVVGYDFYKDFALQNSSWLIFDGGSNPNLFHSPTFRSDFLAGLGCYPGTFARLQILSAVAICFKRIRRFAATFLVLFTLLGANYSESVSVLTNYFLLFGISLSILPAEISIQRAFLIGGMSAAWFLSAFNKINSNFLSGGPVQFELRYIARPFAYALMKNELYSRIAGATGLFLEGLSSLIFWPGSALATVGFLASQIFATAVMLHINGGHGILKFCLGLCFLLEFSWARTELFLFLVFGPIIYELTAKLALDPFILRGLFFTYSLTFATVFLILICCLDSRTTPFVPNAKNMRYGALLLCLCYTAIVRIFSLPIPFGWTQYSGLRDEDPAYVTYLKGQPTSNLSKYFGTVTWEQTQVLLTQDRIATASPHSTTAGYLFDFFCQQNASGIFYAQETMAARNFIKLAYDGKSLSERMDRALATAKPLACQPVRGP